MQIKRCLLLGRKARTKLDSVLKSRDITLPTKVRILKAMVFPVVMYGCESWIIKSSALKNWCFWTVVLEKTLKSPLDCKEIKPVNPKGNQSWIFLRRTDAETEAPVLWPPDAKNWLIGNDPDAGKDWRHEEKGMTEDAMVGWHHQLNGHSLVMEREAWCAAVYGVRRDWATELMCQNGVAVKRLEMSLFLRETVKGFTERWLIRTWKIGCVTKRGEYVHVGAADTEHQSMTQHGMKHGIKVARTESQRRWSCKGKLEKNWDSCISY